MTEPPFAADLTTYLYQANESLWSERLRVKNLDMKLPFPAQRADAVIGAAGCGCTLLPGSALCRPSMMI